jgi:hypothetical protein
MIGSNMLRRLLLIPIACLSLPVFGQGQWKDLFPKGSMDAWEPIGDGIWNMRSDGVLAGMRKGGSHQAWLYTKAEYGEFDLKLQYWIKLGENSGVSIRDKTRAAFACGDKHVPDKTPSHNGYEIQILSGWNKTDKNPSGSIYNFASAKGVRQNDEDWNEMEIRSRKTGIEVLVNGISVASHPGDPKRPLDGPIGLQLHDPRTLILFRNVQIRSR